MRQRALGLAAVAALLLLTANVSASAASPSASPAAAASKGGPPAQVLGLNVQNEDITKTLATDKRSLYVDQVILYSFREPSKLLQATLEVARFKSNAPATSRDFQSTIVSSLSGSQPIVLRVNGEAVYIATSKGLTIAVWFRSGHMMALSIRNTFTTPKQLLRIALAINP